MFTIQTDKNLQEIFEYPLSSFPFIAWKDDYAHLTNETLGTHWHNDFEFAVLLSGELDYYLSEQHLQLKAGDCIFVNANTLHMAKKCGNKNTVMIGITFRPSILGYINEGQMVPKYFEQIVNSQVLGFLLDEKSRYTNIIKKIILEFSKIDLNDKGYELLTIGLVSKLWYNMIHYWEEHEETFITRNTNDKKETDIKKMISYIKNNYMNNITIKQLYKCANISRTECFRVFKQFTGKTPIEYLTEHRLCSAANLLCLTNETATEISVKCGFFDTSYFGKIFKKKYRTSPVLFRKNHQKQI